MGGMEPCVCVVGDPLRIPLPSPPSPPPHFFSNPGCTEYLITPTAAPLATRQFDSPPPPCLASQSASPCPATLVLASPPLQGGVPGGARPAAQWPVQAERDQLPGGRHEGGAGPAAASAGGQEPGDGRAARTGAEGGGGAVQGGEGLALLQPVLEAKSQATAELLAQVGEEDGGEG